VEKEKSNKIVKLQIEIIVDSRKKIKLKKKNKFWTKLLVRWWKKKVC